MSPPSVLMPHGPMKLVTGSLVVCLPPSPNSNVRSRATGRLDRSGLGIRTGGTWLRSGVAGSRTMRNSRKRPTHGSGDWPLSAWLSVRSAATFLPSWCSARFTNQRAVDVVHPGDALVHVLRGEAEHVVVEPVGAHRLVPVARDLGDAAVVIWATAPRIGRVGVDGAEAGDHP